MLRGVRASRAGLSILALCLPLTGMATIIPAERAHYTESRDRLLQALSDLSLPSGITNRTESFVFLSLGPSRLDFFALAKPGEDETAFAKACDDGLHAAGLPDLQVKYSRERGLDVLDTDYDHYRLGRSEASLSLDVGQLRRALEQRGYRPTLVLGWPPYANISGIAGEGEGHGRQRFHDLAGVDGVVTAKERLGPLDYAGLLWFILAVPVFALSGFAWGAKIARREGFTIERQRKAYRNVLMGSVYAAMAVHLPVFVWLFAGGVMSRMTDLWFGSDLKIVFILGLMLPLPVLSYAAKKLKPLEASLFGTTVGEIDRKQREHLRRNLPGFFVAMGITTGFLIVAVFGVAKLHERRMMALVPLGALIGLAAMSYMERAAKERERRELGGATDKEKVEPR